MESFLSGKIFRLLLLPLITVALGVVIKMVSRPPSKPRFKSEDFCVGMDVILAAVMMMIGTYSERALSMQNATRDLAAELQRNPQGMTSTQIQARIVALTQTFVFSPWLIFVIMAGMWATSAYMQALGWDTTKTPHELNRWHGIVIPILIGVGIQIAVVVLSS
ncbi:MAG: hypothetical protein JWM10_1121 [Myxococcaceae bacterium]|nr:hypothetical protein [Myxococcaceae bacterium]